MAKQKPDVIEIEDEIVFSPRGNAEPSPEVAAAVSKQGAQVAPTHDELMAYWKPGREITMEVPQLMVEHRTPCATCGALLHYIPVAGQDAPVLVCASH